MIESRLVTALQPCSPSHITAENKHGLCADVLTGGWALFIQKNVLPEVTWFQESGVKPRFLIQNPFSSKAGAYQFDQYIHAKNSGIITTKDFRECWRPITAQAEVIFYTGTLHSDPDFDNRRQAGELDDFARRINDSAGPFLDVDGSVGFDMGHDWPVGSIEYESLDFLRALLRSHNLGAYIEPRPYATCENLHDWNIIASNNFWLRSDPDAYQDSAAWAAKNNQLTGEIVRWLDQPFGGFGGTYEQVAGRLGPQVREILADGHSCAVATDWFRLAGLSYADVVK